MTMTTTPTTTTATTTMTTATMKRRPKFGNRDPENGPSRNFWLRRFNYHQSAFSDDQLLAVELERAYTKFFEPQPWLSQSFRKVFQNPILKLSPSFLIFAPLQNVSFRLQSLKNPGELMKIYFQANTGPSLIYFKPSLGPDSLSLSIGSFQFH